MSGSSPTSEAIAEDYAFLDSTEWPDGLALADDLNKIGLFVDGMQSHILKKHRPLLESLAREDAKLGILVSSSNGQGGDSSSRGRTLRGSSSASADELEKLLSDCVRRQVEDKMYTSLMGPVLEVGRYSFS